MMMMMMCYDNDFSTVSSSEWSDLGQFYEVSNIRQSGGLHKYNSTQQATFSVATKIKKE